MRLFALVLNVLLFAFTLYIFSKGGFQNQPRDILLQFLLLITPAVNLAVLLRKNNQEKWML